MSAAVALTAVPAGAAPVGAARAGAPAPACATGWGSLPKSASSGSSAPLTDVRAGRHDCFDRMVVEVPGTGKGLGHRVRYVDRVVQDGSGRAVAVRGGAVLEVRVAAPAHDDAGQPSYPAVAGGPLPGVNLAGYRTFRDARFVGSFEGETQIGLGVRARLPFRVLTLTDRVVVDVAHGW
ncbi:MAG TPA: hypothetical protein VFP69_11700 [Streptomyces sp.]|jgi:hypothetical protein|nr:hypothetical protein [Streptomyces sp.]